MADGKTLAVVFAYNAIRNTLLQMKIVPQLGTPGINTVDLILAIVGYMKRDTWWGEGLLYGSIAFIGSQLLPSIQMGFASGSTSSGGSAQGEITF